MLEVIKAEWGRADNKRGRKKGGAGQAAGASERSGSRSRGADSRHELLYSNTLFAAHHVHKMDKYDKEWYHRVHCLSAKHQSATPG